VGVGHDQLLQHRAALPGGARRVHVDVVRQVHEEREALVPLLGLVLVAEATRAVGGAAQRLLVVGPAGQRRRELRRGRGPVAGLREVAAVQRAAAIGLRRREAGRVRDQRLGVLAPALLVADERLLVARLAGVLG